MIEITQQFGFDAAHYLEEAPLGSNRRLHGHSFYAEVTLKGEPDARTGWVRDFTEVNTALADIRVELDHQLLNDIGGKSAVCGCRVPLSANPAFMRKAEHGASLNAAGETSSHSRVAR